jgi:hypothetical protein
MQAKNLHGFRSRLLLLRAAMNLLLASRRREIRIFRGRGCYGGCILVTNLILDAYYEKRVGFM